MRMRFYLKGGQSFALEFTEFESVRSPINGSLHSIEAKYPNDEHRHSINFIDMKEVQAIVRETL